MYRNFTFSPNTYFHVDRQSTVENLKQRARKSSWKTLRKENNLVIQENVRHKNLQLAPGFSQSRPDFNCSLIPLAFSVNKAALK